MLMPHNYAWPLLTRHRSLLSSSICYFIHLYIYKPIDQLNQHTQICTFMGILPDRKEIMEASLSSSSTTKVERRVIEKNRRNHMKILYAHLNSLLPNQNSKVHRSHPFPYICSLYADCLNELGFQLHSN